MTMAGILPAVTFPRAECETCPYGTRRMKPIQKTARLHDGRTQLVTEYVCTVECQHECERDASI
jgi:hypothetical protein